MQTAINIVTSIFAILFVIIFIRTLMNGRFKGIFKKAKADALVEMNTELSKKKGYKPFYFEYGNVVIWSKLYKDAKNQYTNYRRNLDLDA